MAERRTVDEVFADAHARGKIVTCGTCGEELPRPEAVLAHFMVRHGWRVLQGAHTDN